jgi:hypothetical protein
MAKPVDRDVPGAIRSLVDRDVPARWGLRWIATSRRDGVSGGSRRPGAMGHPRGSAATLSAPFGVAPPLQQPRFPEAEKRLSSAVGSSHNHMVKQLDLQNLRRLRKAPGEGLVRPAG